MKKIGIITLNDYKNYGNQLQLFAMQELLSDFGDVQNLWWYDIHTDKKHERVSDIFKHGIRILFSPFVKKFKRYNRFFKFNKRHIKTYKKKLVKAKHFEKVNKEFDYFVAGSDQIWNPNFHRTKSVHTNMLGWASKEKKIAVAPSIAVDLLTEKQTELFKKCLEDFDKLSCREKQGSELLENLTGKKVVTLVDPTLALGANKWKEFAKKPNWHNENEEYIFMYFLGNESVLAKYIATKFAEKHGLKIIDVMEAESKYYLSDPQEFVYLIKNAKLVLTDSFHGSVFSYLFDKPFRIFERQGKIKSMNSRLSNLMQTLDLGEDVIFKGEKSLENIFEANYNKSKLEKEQEKFKNYLKQSFKE